LNSGRGCRRPVDNLINSNAANLAKPELTEVLTRNFRRLHAEIAPVAVEGPGKNLFGLFLILFRLRRLREHTGGKGTYYK
jgi:hypothetical protein